MSIDVGGIELDIGVKAYSDNIHELIDFYYPVCQITALMSTVIVLRDEIPVHKRQRRLEPRKKSVVEQRVEEWLTTRKDNKTQLLRIFHSGSSGDQEGRHVTIVH